jgi:hypothetical protein
MDTWTDLFNKTYLEQRCGHMDQPLQLNIFGAEMWTHGPTSSTNKYGAETWTRGPTSSTKNIWSREVDTWTDPLN